MTAARSGELEPAPARPDVAPDHRPAEPRRWLVEALCGPEGEAVLVHRGEEYRLRVTARGRLILTK